MLNKLLSMVRRYGMIEPGDRVICAVSGGADSVALLFALYLLKEKLDIRLAAAHFNHHLRGEESQKDEAFVRDLCDRFGIRLFIGEGEILPDGKGLEAAARDARYAFLRSLPGKIATAHTADDNAETVLLHLVRGTGLKGLGAIAPVNGNVIRPMLSVTRQEVESFLEEYCLRHVEDSSNGTDAFLRNRLRHHVMPLLKAENPRLAENLSEMALRLREDEAVLAELTETDGAISVKALREMSAPRRSRILERFLKDSGVREPERTHIAQADALVFSEKPSARADFPGGITVTRCYDTLQVLCRMETVTEHTLSVGESVDLPQLNLRVTCREAGDGINTPDTFTVVPVGNIIVRARRAGDAIRLSGGTKSLKKLFIDRKIPAADRDRIPVVSDDAGILGVYGLGSDLNRREGSGPSVSIIFEHIDHQREAEK